MFTSPINHRFSQQEQGKVPAWEASPVFSSHSCPDPVSSWASKTEHPNNIVIPDNKGQGFQQWQLGKDEAGLLVPKKDTIPQAQTYNWQPQKLFVVGGRSPHSALGLQGVERRDYTLGKGAILSSLWQQTLNTWACPRPSLWEWTTQGQLCYGSCTSSRHRATIWLTQLCEKTTRVWFCRIGTKNLKQQANQAHQDQAFSVTNRIA